MGFFAPWLLLLGLAAAVPVLLHLMHRRPGPRLDFPALRYLRRAERESGRRVRLRQLLLLALRVAAVLLLGLAAARPFLRAGAGAHPPTDVVIVLDNSMSTGAVTDDGRVFDELRAAAHAALAAGGPDDRFWLIRAAEPWQPALFGDRARIAAAVDAAGPVDARADLRAAVHRAAALLAAAEPSRPREIHLLTDLQASAFAPDTTDAALVWAGPGAASADMPTVLLFGPGSVAPVNRGVGAVEVAGGLAPRAGESASLAASVAGTGSDSVTLRLWLDDRPVAAALAAPGEAALFTLPPRHGGFAVGRVEAEPDALRADDRRWFTYEVTPPVPVAVAASAAFVTEGFAALAAANRIRLVAPGSATVLVAEAAALPADRASADALVLLAPDSALLLAAANASLARVGSGLRLEADARVGASTFDAAAPAELRGARVERAYRIDVRDGAPTDTLLRLADGRPWLVRRELPSGQRALLFATPFAADASTIPASSAMIPLLDRATGEWAGGAGVAARAREPGTVVTLPPRAAALIDPADSVLAVEGGAPFTLPARAGVYRALAAATSGAETLAAWAVAAPASESRLERIADAGAVTDALAGDVRVVHGDMGRWRDTIFADRSGSEWWRALLLAAILALLVETLVAGTGRTDAARTRVVITDARPAGGDAGS